MLYALCMVSLTFGNLKCWSPTSWKRCVSTAYSPAASFRCLGWQLSFLLFLAFRLLRFQVQVWLFCVAATTPSSLYYLRCLERAAGKKAGACPFAYLISGAPLFFCPMVFHGFPIESPLISTNVSERRRHADLRPAQTPHAKAFHRDWCPWRWRSDPSAANDWDPNNYWTPSFE